MPQRHNYPKEFAEAREERGYPQNGGEPSSLRPPAKLGQDQETQDGDAEEESEPDDEAVPLRPGEKGAGRSEGGVGGWRLHRGGGGPPPRQAVRVVGEIVAGSAGVRIPEVEEGPFPGRRREADPALRARDRRPREAQGGIVPVQDLDPQVAVAHTGEIDRRRLLPSLRPGVAIDRPGGDRPPILADLPLERLGVLHGALHDPGLLLASGEAQAAEVV